MHVALLIASASIFFACLMEARADSIRDILSPGNVVQGHARIESECVKCHKQFDKAAQSGLCRDCHKEVGKDFSEKSGFHGRIKEDKQCKECHTDHKGRDAHIVLFDPDKFDHMQSDFQLKGGHLNEKVKCKSCHLPKIKFREAPATCNGCHKKDDKHKGGLGPDCAKCHEEKNWKTTKFDHDKTNYRLLGKHAEVKCTSCHIAEKFKNTPTQCNACHRKDDKHKGSFGSGCETCHVDKGWKEILFDHDKKTKYPLFGKHRPPAKCNSCHKGDLYKDQLKMNCDSCHKKDDKHKGSFGLKCERCHMEWDWKEILFDHDRHTKYPLLGKHRPPAKCTSCHKGDLYKDKLKVSCDSCHMKDDKHKGGFGLKCGGCHVERGWKEILFDHGRQTKYPLLGKHRPPAKCTSCHKGDLYKDKLPTSCYACHQSDDKHKGQQGKKCEPCHTEQSWNNAVFDHRLSHFALTGKHVLTECKKCHAAPTFKDAKSDCWSCHEKQDTHKRRLGILCEDCHSTRAWKVWDFDHDKTSFKLDGGHKNVACYDCHQRPMSKKVSLSATCGSCHDKDDVHNGNFGRQCERCHEVSSWKKIRSGGRLLQ